MREEGVRFTCSRCGIKQFHSWKMVHNKYPDEKPENWLIVDKADTIHLCPRCAKKYTSIFDNFLKGGVIK